MGYPRGGTSATGITTSMRHKILGACLDFNISNWLIGASLKLQKSATHAAHLSSYTTQSTFDLTKFPNEWIVDGGATAHFTGHITDYINYNTIDHKLVKGMNLFAVATGTVKMETLCIRKSDNAVQLTTITLHNVLHVPDLLKKGNHVTRLMSQRAAHKTHNQYLPVLIDAADFSVIGVGHFYIPMDQHIQHNLLTLHTKICSANIPTELAFTTISNVQTTTRALWHKRLGHISSARLNKMMTSATGIRFKERTTVNEHCESCALTKSVRIASANKTTNKNFLPFEKVGCDIWSHSTISVRGYYHILGFTCYTTGYLTFYLMKLKMNPQRCSTDT